MNNCSPSEEEIIELQNILRNHPIDPDFDPNALEYDCKDLNKLNQMAAHLAYDVLKNLGRLPDGVE